MRKILTEKLKKWLDSREVRDVLKSTAEALVGIMLIAVISTFSALYIVTHAPKLNEACRKQCSCPCPTSKSAGSVQLRGSVSEFKPSR